jgi:hypothetical protein
MKKYALITAVLAAVMFFWMPADSGSVSAQGRSQSRGHSNRDTNGDSNRDWNRRSNRGTNRRWNQQTDPVQWQGRHNSRWNRGRKNTYGYRNYGQYRRTQVGNRRYRITRRYNRPSGIRLVRRAVRDN